MMDPANRSLADALRVAYRLVQFSMIILAVLFLFSGFQSIREGQRGLHLLLGRVQNQDLQPGFVLTMPKPFGELIAVSTGPQTLKLDTPFMPQVPEEQRGRTVVELRTTLASKIQLDPAVDGSLITADGNLLHGRFTVTYRRVEPEQNDSVSLWAQSVDPDSEARLVRLVVQQALVRAAARLSIDDVLKDRARLGGEARQIAQSTLRRTGPNGRSPISIDDVLADDVVAPFNVQANFEEVQNKQSEARKLIEDAQKMRVSMLTEAAGEAAEPLRQLITRYGGLLEQAEAAERAGQKDNVAQLKKQADDLLASIHALLDDKVVTIDGQEVRAPIGGRAAKLIANANSSRSAAVSVAETAARRVSDELAAFQRNPAVFVRNRWSAAFQEFAALDSVDQIYLPPDVVNPVVWINQAAEIAKGREQARIRREAQRRRDEAIRQNESTRFGGTPTGTRVTAE